MNLQNSTKDIVSPVISLMQTWMTAFSMETQPYPPSFPVVRILLFSIRVRTWSRCSKSKAVMASQYWLAHSSFSKRKQVP